LLEALMKAAPLRFLSAAAWPLTIWTSLTHLEEHPADDYVERTTPIVATAIGFWLGVAILVTTTLFSTRVMEIDSGGGVMRVFTRGPQTAADVLWFIVPVLYVVGLWLYTLRDERFPR
jgi:hypothetical protein